MLVVSMLLVSDQDRENTVGLLRGHWLAGRLTAAQREARALTTADPSLTKPEHARILELSSRSG